MGLKDAFGFGDDNSGGGGGGNTLYTADDVVGSGRVATITDTLTFASGNVVMGTSANLLIGLNELQFVTDKIYNDGTALQIEGTTGGVDMLDQSGVYLTWSAQSLSLAGTMLLDASTADSIIKYISVNGSAFDGTLGVISGLTANRTWRLPDASGTLALVGGAGLDGIYGGSGTIPSSVVATLTDEFTFSGGTVAVNSTLSMGAGDEIQFSAGGVITLIDTLEINSGRLGIGGTPDASSILELVSTSQGFLPPRVANTSAVTTPAKGLIIYDLSTDQWMGNSGTSGSPNWVILG